MDSTVATTYGDHVIVTEHAIIHVERRSEEERRQASWLTLALGGVLGPLVAAVADRVGMPGGPLKLHLRPADIPAVHEMTEVLTCWAADVPPEVAALPNWPRVEGFRAVTFYPRVSLAAVDVSRWGGLRLTLRREAAKDVRIPVPLWSVGRIAGHLDRAGYLSRRMP